uniref:Peptidase S1 domain-containing protein n=1 Tax=Anopheles culicifacies TaxID=139723 RepID=A0A182MKA2_9DIPT
MYTYLIHDGYDIPYAVGLNSVHLEGLYALNVFVKVAQFAKWIKTTINNLGESLPLFDPLACAKDYIDHHRKIKGRASVVKSKPLDFMVKFQEHPETDQTNDCVGTLINQNMVVTLAQCTTGLMWSGVIRFIHHNDMEHFSAS